MNDILFIQKVIENAKKSLATDGYPASSLIVYNDGSTVVEKVNEAIANNNQRLMGRLSASRKSASN